MKEKGKKMIRGWKKLTKKEKNHVTFDAGCRNTLAWKRNVKFQILMATEGQEHCLECKWIAQKLGDWRKEG